MKYTLGFYIDHTKKGLKGLYLVSNDMEQEFFANPGESTRDFLERVGVDLKDVEPTREVMHNIYR